METQKGKIYLTFDDGPHQLYTGELLELLSAESVKGTFFVVGKFAEDNWNIVEETALRGHRIGFHSMEHKSAYLQGPFYSQREFLQMNRLYERLLLKFNDMPKLYRAPWGHKTPITMRNMRKFGFNYVGWNLMADDWKEDISPEEISQKIIAGAYKNLEKNRNTIICLHDGRGKNEAPRRTIKALENAIPILKNNFEFCDVDDILT